MTLIERAARAMADNLESHEENWQGYVHCVRAVLREIRDPSDEAIAALWPDALHMLRPADKRQVAVEGWRMMIDAALSEGG